MLFLEYPKCTTCQKAKKWLLEQGCEFESRHIVEQNPTEAELDEWQQTSGLPLKRFFNTSGMKYKELGLKDRLSDMSREEQLSLLATDGMLVKRPILLAAGTAVPGFRETDWKEAVEKESGEAEAMKKEADPS